MQDKFTADTGWVDHDQLVWDRTVTRTSWDVRRAAYVYSHFEFTDAVPRRIGFVAVVYQHMTESGRYLWRGHLFDQAAEAQAWVDYWLAYEREAKE